MSIAKIVEISASSPDSFEDAIRQAIRRASETLDNIRGAWVSEQKVVIEDNEIVEYRADLKVTFELD
jgi:hypothetical protein